MSSKKSHLTTLSEFKDQHYGPRGTAKREELETGFESFEKEAATAKLAHKVAKTRPMPRKSPSTSISPPSQP